MITDVQGLVGLQSVLVSSLAKPVAGYLVTLTEATGATAPAPVAMNLGETGFAVSLDVGTWTASVVAVDADGNALTQPVVSEPLVLSAPATVQVPLTIALTIPQ